MPMASFRDQIASGYHQLLQISEQQSRHPVREAGWSRKEILGHLIDSALNNHQRFVRAASRALTLVLHTNRRAGFPYTVTDPCNGTFCFVIGIPKTSYCAKWWSGF